MKTTPVSVFNTADAAGGAGAPTRRGLIDPAAATFYSLAWSPDTYGLHVSFTGTLTGTLTMWCSDKPDPVLSSDADWVEDTGFSPTNPAGAAGKFRDDVTNANARWKRLKYVSASGAGTLFADVTGV